MCLYVKLGRRHARRKAYGPKPLAAAKPIRFLLTCIPRARILKRNDSGIIIGILRLIDRA
jgi:hypothetical protein